MALGATGAGFVPEAGTGVIGAPWITAPVLPQLLQLLQVSAAQPQLFLRNRPPKRLSGLSMMPQPQLFS